MDLLRSVRGHTTCGSVLLTSESNLCCAPLAAETVSWGGTGWKKMNSWTDFLSLCCLMLGGKFAHFHTQSELDGFVGIPHCTWTFFFLMHAHGHDCTWVVFCWYVRWACDWKVASWNLWTAWGNVGRECKWVILSPFSAAVRCPWARHWIPDRFSRTALILLYRLAPSSQQRTVLSNQASVAKIKQSWFEILRSVFKRTT